MHHGEQIFEIQLDYLAHELLVDSAAGRSVRRSLPGMSVADFYAEVTAALHLLGIGVRIAQPRAFDLGDRRAFATDTIHRSYDPESVTRYWRILTTVDSILKEFGWRYTGKSSPVHHFWHSFDIAVTRFSGRGAPVDPRADHVTREAYSHEVISFGFWFGDDKFPAPAFYAYAAPEPEELAGQPLEPAEASWTERAGSHLAVLPWAAVRTARQPRAAALAFLESAWRAGTVTQDLRRVADVHGADLVGVRRHPVPQQSAGTVAAEGPERRAHLERPPVLGCRWPRPGAATRRGVPLGDEGGAGDVDLDLVIQSTWTDVFLFWPPCCPGHS